MKKAGRPFWFNKLISRFIQKYTYNKNFMKKRNDAALRDVSQYTTVMQFVREACMWSGRQQGPRSESDE